MKQISKERIGRLRLIKLGTYLGKLKSISESEDFKVITFYKQQGDYKIEIEAKCYAWIFDELSQLFPDWPYNASDNDFEAMPAVFDFFSLSDEEFWHMFDLNGHQNVEFFGGKILSEESTVNDISENILAIVRKRKQQIDIDKSKRKH